MWSPYSTDMKYSLMICSPVVRVTTKHFIQPLARLITSRRYVGPEIIPLTSTESHVLCTLSKLVAQSSKSNEKSSGADSTCLLPIVPTYLVIWRVTPATLPNLERVIPLAALRRADSSCKLLSTSSYLVLLEVTMVAPLTLKRAELSHTMRKTEDSSWLKQVARSSPGIGVASVVFTALTNLLPLEGDDGNKASSFRIVDPYENIPIYNYVGGSNTFTFQENTHVVLERILEVPSTQAIWYPWVIPFRTVFWYRLFAIFVHVIPGALLDIAFVIKGNPPMLVKLYRKIDKYMLSMKYFTRFSWNFDNRNCMNLYQSLSPEDKKIFYFDSNTYDCRDYMRLCIDGGRFYLFKESPDTIPEGKSRLMK
uniref:Fatty acyl-CoA reductase C-terminal domain-containing protein n=1 Tax=Timema cristinae TaxID=61476 RepID=A0A7R9DGV8_TIMCR|nr:unnamed protein product [Timema cristinae]